MDGVSIYEQTYQALPLRACRYFLRKIRETYTKTLWNSSYRSEELAFYHNKLLELKNKHKNQAGFVIGNGPSLNNQDLTKLKGIPSIASNSFFLMADRIGFMPPYYTIEDPLPAEDNAETIAKLQNTIKLIPYDLKHIIKQSENSIYVNFQRSYRRPSRESFPWFSENFEKNAYWGGTVAFYSLQLAYHLGLNPIYLIGVDLTYKIPANIIRNGNILTSTDNDPNHFDERYFGKGKRWHLPEVERMQRSFEKAYQFLSSKGVQLYNATDGGNLKVIPRVNFNDIL